MARLEVIVDEVEVPTDGGPVEQRLAGLLLADILERTGGQYVWELPIDANLRRRWSRVASDIGDATLQEKARRSTVRVSLEQFRGRDPKATWVRISFDLNFTPEEGMRAARADGARSAQ